MRDEVSRLLARILAGIRHGMTLPASTFGTDVEEVFVHVFEQTQSDDLSAYVSDDFGLLAEALHLGYEDEWLNGLATIYSDGRIPCETVEPKPGMLRDHLNKLSGS